MTYENRSERDSHNRYNVVSHTTIKIVRILQIVLFGILTSFLFLAVGLRDENKKKLAGDKKISDEISFKGNILPVFKHYCLPCHTEENMNPSELYLDSYDNVKGGGRHGRSVVVGKPDSSYLIQKISKKPPFGEPMPLRAKKPFPSDALQLLRLWITQGAKNN